MNAIKTISAGLAGTTFMTLYSYTMAKKQKKQYKEPVLLYKFLEKGKQWARMKSNHAEQPQGWLLHYSAGLLFSVAYDQIWKKTEVAPSIPAGIILGAASGLAGVGIWNATFKLHPNPPKVDQRDFYKHLIAAHVIFGIFSSLGYRLPDALDKYYPELKKLMPVAESGRKGDGVMERMKERWGDGE